MYFVYLLECRDKSIYCGYTNQLVKRVETHSKGQGAKYTQRRRPVKLVYFEEFESRSDAMRREHQIKGFSRGKKLEMIKKNGI